MRTIVVLLLYLLSFVPGSQILAQIKKTPTKKKYRMNDVNGNEKAIRNLYDEILNQRHLDQLANLVDEMYTNEQGETGLAGFKKGIMNMLKGFPDARWTIEYLVADDSKVVVKQTVTGTHTNVFQNIPPTGKRIVNDGFVMYELNNGKIIRHQILTDRLSFLQQLEILPSDVITRSETNESPIYFVDKFLIPRTSIDEFISRMQYNRDFIKTLPGFISDKVIARPVEEEKISLITIAEWSSQQHLDSAKTLVQQEYRRIGFNPAEFLQKLNVTMEREQFVDVKNIDTPSH